MPTGPPDDLSQVTLPSPGSPVPAAPQQSLLSRQRSPSTWQPLAGWQTNTPVGAYGAHSRLQQSVQEPHRVPSTPSVQNVGAVGGAAQVPSVLPCAIVQVPEQHCDPAVQTSLVWTQNDEPSWQRPLEQSPEQQSAFVVHAFPAVRHAVVSGTHLFAVQVPPQHCPFDVQLPLSDTHAVPEHLPPTQFKLQHSVDTVHAAPLAEHTLVLGAHVCFVASQIREQQSFPVAQTSPNL